MRLVVVGCEYSGVTTLIDAVNAWGLSRGILHHLDDHFTIPDAYHLSDEEQQAMTAMLPAIKERFQRFQIVYHVRLLHKYEHILLGGFHIEEAVYGPRYYYPGIGVEIREYEPEMPKDTILVHLYARPEVIRARMVSSPHPYPLVPAEDVPLILDRFQEEVGKSWLHHRMAIDTSDLTPKTLFDTFMEKSLPQLNVRDAVTRIK
ncbi:MAG: hypothetical protein FJY97_21545 [candidate division Zixibacteria bacterium]|nr:hypothetical protein [candidate division Zixibacteria bacterium]